MIPTDKQADAALLAVETEDEVLRFVKGLRGPRKNPVTKKQIMAHLKKYSMFSAASVEDALTSLLNDGKINIVGMRLGSHRRWNGAYGYEAR